MPRVQNGGGGSSLATPVSVANGGTGTANALIFYTPFTNNNGGTAGFGFNANQTIVIGQFIPYPLSVGNITLNVTTADAVNNYDIGFYNSLGALVAHTGAIHLPSTGFQTFPLTGGTFAPTAGLYYLALTANVATAQLGFLSGMGGVYTSTTSGGVTAGGVLGATITPPAKAVSLGVNLPQWALD
jgi:hypothetical protein